MNTGPFLGLMILWSTVQVRVGPPIRKPRIARLLSFLAFEKPVLKIISPVDDA